VDVLLSALSILPAARRPTATLVGEGRDLESFKRLSADLGLSATTHFTGRLPMSTAMQLGRILVMPSRNESFPYVVLEAAAAAIPMIASDVGGIAEILPREWLVPADNPAALAAAMADAMDHPDRLHLGALELQSTAKEKFSTTRMATETLAFYRQLL